MTWTLRDATNAPVAAPPAELTFRFFYEGSPETPGATVEAEHRPVGEPVVASRHDEGIPMAYWPTRFTPEEVGFYSVAVELDGEELTSSFQVEAQEDVPMIEVGERMPAIETPTVADARGVDPICTRDPQCDLHGETLAQALTAGRPVAFLVGTPEFCQTGVCGPVLDLLLDAAPGHAGITYLHAEVYNDPRNPSGDPTAEGTTPAVDECGLSFEPTLYLVGADGVVADRLDNIYDAVEAPRGPVGTGGLRGTSTDANRPARRPVRSRPGPVPAARRTGEQGGVLVVDGAAPGAASAQEKDWPQPQVRWALGLSMANPASWSESL
ncbi:MAG: hypothetical protein U5R31_16450 [Acidimicrobiia bacterium]|nr:hypothetical protein [Acidimicrobiia bacterium]